MATVYAPLMIMSAESCLHKWGAPQAGRLAASSGRIRDAYYPHIFLSDCEYSGSFAGARSGGRVGRSSR